MSENCQGWIQMEHYRFHLVEDWPENPYKHATLAAIRSILRRLLADSSGPTSASQCSICRDRSTGILEPEKEERFRLTTLSRAA